MILVDREVKHNTESFANFNTYSDAIKYLERGVEIDEKLLATDYLLESTSGAEYLLKEIESENIDLSSTSKIAHKIAKMDRRKIPIERAMNLLKHQNVHIRECGILILKNNEEVLEYYILKLLIDTDPDLRIFSLNVIGDINFAKGRNMILELLESEKDVNVAMTAVDYLAEIGHSDDVSLLQQVRERFENEFYAHYAIDNAIGMILGEEDV